MVKTEKDLTGFQNTSHNPRLRPRMGYDRLAI